MKKKVAVLGCTGSIGRQSMNVLCNNLDKFEVVAISANSSAESVINYANEFKPKYIGLSNTYAAQKVEQEIKSYSPEIICGNESSSLIAELDCVDIVINGISGFSGMMPLIKALNANKVVALANKESIVCGHKFVYEALNNGHGKIIPVDSEQSAIFQCLNCGTKKEVSKLILTASGGPFKDYSRDMLYNVKVEDALNHPTWQMGRKITIDSATLFNKGLEIMEAKYLFDVPKENVQAVIQPQSIIHSMVEYCDGTVMAQMSVPDMRLAIQYALSYPERIDRIIDRLDFEKMSAITFRKIDTEIFKAIPLAYAALDEEEYLPIVYNAANEMAVDMFINEKIGFMDIAEKVEYAMNKIEKMSVSTVDDIFEVDRIARDLVKYSV